MSATTDGGRTSTVLARLPGPVTWVAVAPSRVAWAIVGACTKGTCSHELCRSSDGGASWSRLGPAPLQAVAFGDAAHGLAVGGGILSTADGGRTWRGLASPCPDGARGVSMVSARRGWLLCVRILGVGNADKTVYGRTMGACTGGGSRRSGSRPASGASPAACTCTGTRRGS